jgi:hypothetical protein
MSSSSTDQRVGSPVRALEWLEAVAGRFRQDGHRGHFIRALVQHANCMERDAELEADRVEAMLRPDYLLPLVLEGPAVSLRALEERCRRHATDAGVFLLGSSTGGAALVSSALVGLVLGKTLYVRPAATQLPAMRVLARAILGGAAGAAGAPLTLLDLSDREPSYHSALAGLPVSSALLWGTQEAIEVTAACLPQVVEACKHRFGPRTGVLVLEPAWWQGLGDIERRSVAQACYDNLFCYDAGLHSSPTAAVALGRLADCRQMADELMALAVPHADERERLARLAGANARRRSMSQWSSHGYTLHRSRTGAGQLALGTLDDYQRKNHYLPEAPTYHDSAAALEVLCFARDELGEAARFLATLQQEPRYRGMLWSIAHIALAASAALGGELRDALGLAHSHVPGTRRVAASGVRLLDVRANLAAMPGFDGASLLDVLLPPEDSAPASRGRALAWLPRESEVPSFLSSLSSAPKRRLLS